MFGGAQVDALAGTMSRPMQSVSMGSSEGYDMADRALHLASKQGCVSFFIIGFLWTSIGTSIARLAVSSLHLLHSLCVMPPGVVELACNVSWPVHPTPATML